MLLLLGSRQQREMHGSRSRAPSLAAITTHESVLPLLAKSLSVFGRVDRFDANAAQPAVLAAIGLSPKAINALVASRRRGRPATAIPETVAERWRRGGAFACGR